MVVTRSTNHNHEQFDRQSSNIKLVGILNLTPDSFSDGGQYDLVYKAIERAREMFGQGAYWVDVGAEATNPFVTPISAGEEWLRLEPALKALLKQFPGKICVDSYHPETQRKAATLGPIIINDVTGCNNPEMINISAETGMKIIVSHLPAKHSTDIQAAHEDTSPMSNIKQVADELLLRYNQLLSAGVSAKNIILDPGIGFGKTHELSGQLLEFPAYIKHLDPEVKVMLGYSRKRFLGDKRMTIAPNLEAGNKAMASGADYLRVHDVAGHQSLTN